MHELMACSGRYCTPKSAAVESPLSGYHDSMVNDTVRALAGVLRADYIRSARAVGLVAQCVEYHRGSKVNDWQPLFQLTAQLANPAQLAKASQASSSANNESYASNESFATLASKAPAAASPAGEPRTHINEAAHALTEAEEGLTAPSLTQQGLRLLQAIVAAHQQVLLAFQSPAVVELCAFRTCGHRSHTDAAGIACPATVVVFTLWFQSHMIAAPCA